MFTKFSHSYSIFLFIFLLLLCLVFSPVIVVFSQEPESWMKTFGGTRDDDSFSAIIAPDGGYILTGDTASSGAGNTDVWC